MTLGDVLIGISGVFVLTVFTLMASHAIVAKMGWLDIEKED